jgi:hypothetical protein
LGQNKDFSLRWCFHDKPPCGLSVAPLAQQLRPLLCVEEAVMSPCETTNMGGPGSIVARFG